MVEEAIIEVIRNYLKAVREKGINAHRAVLFGSLARGEAHEWSDIDLVVIAPELDNLTDRGLVSTLWKLRAKTPSPMSPSAPSVWPSRAPWRSAPAPIGKAD